MQTTLPISSAIWCLAPLGFFVPIMPAAAFEWGAENWGEASWGAIEAIAVPAMPAVLIVALAVVLGTVTARRIAKRGNS